ncbi:Peptidoglycan/xylan/chitin deacetylase, PgdA/CDA1 family [Collimonas sp. OK242]|uniref:polysaccharide deacetylase family protein n=1 Tax=Collimonas sp. OK242 TaxID=1798195 RepID=UPI00089AE5A1|nr:polysaccharide deacetylase family protein [Collimonas sp. OK242]SDY19856.1 Peptidoglycan/xylan/chitin deacetylase, PgdA/CDA1 family [Collimonas sp. OK242]
MRMFPCMFPTLQRNLLAAAVALAALAPAALSLAQPAKACSSGTLFLSFDTGSQSQAEYIAQTLRRHHIKATFFMANEKTVNGDYTLDPAWAPFWKSLVADGHAFGTHTFDHVYAKRDLADGKIEVKPQFGANGGKLLAWTPQQYCDELKRVDQRFQTLTGTHIDRFWRTPGGHLTPHTLAAGEACGYQHVAWAEAGFSGDELPSDKWPNQMLLERMLKNLKDGDIVMAHLGIWSRQDPWAPAVLEPLISGLEKKGFCFATLREHPAYKGNLKGPVAETTAGKARKAS